jgi:hypothetical protein
MCKAGCVLNIISAALIIALVLLFGSALPGL